MGNCLTRSYTNGPISSSRPHSTTEKEGVPSLEATPRKQSSEVKSSFETAQAVAKPISSASLPRAAATGSAASNGSASAAPLPARSALPASVETARPAKPDGLGSKAQDSAQVAPALPPDLFGQPVKENSLGRKHGLGGEAAAARAGMDGGTGDWAAKMAEPGAVRNGSVKVLPPTPMFAHLGNVRKAGSGEARAEGHARRPRRSGMGARGEEGEGAGSGGGSRSGSGRLWVFGGSAGGSSGSRRGMSATAAAAVAGGGGASAGPVDVHALGAAVSAALPRPFVPFLPPPPRPSSPRCLSPSSPRCLSPSAPRCLPLPIPAGNCPAKSQQATALREGRTMCELLNVQQRGKGRHLLIMAHGFGANHTVSGERDSTGQWKDVVELMSADRFTQWKGVVELMSADRFTVLLFDFIGAHGAQHDLFDPVRYVSLKGFADDVALLLDELGIQASSSWQEVTFIGHQQAGMVGLLLALQRPDLFHRVITLASSPRLLSDVGYAGGFELHDLDQVFGVMQSNYTMWAAGCMPVLTPDDIRLPHVRDFTRPLFSLRPDVAFALLKTTFACDVRAVLPE
ncbi:unnamed protein product, partial [Closterium sp. Naga37s-1]